MDIQTKDGILLRNIPDGTPEAEIKARIEKIRAERGGATTAPAPDQQQERQLDPLLQRIGGGIAETAYLGPKQFAAQAFGLAAPEFRRETNEQVRQFQQAQEEGAPQGMDVGRMLGQAIGMAPSAMAAPTVRGAAIAGGLSGLIQAPGEGTERLANAAAGSVGGAVGLKAGQLVGGAILPSGGGLTQAQKAAQEAGERLGFRQTPGYALGNKSLQKLEAAMEASPITGGGISAVKDENQRKFAEIAAKAIGEQGDEISFPVIDRAFERIGGEFDKVATKDFVPLDPQDIQGKLMGVIDEFEGQYTGPYDVSKQQAFKLLDNFGLQGGATREQLVKLSSNLNKAIKSQMTQPNGDRALGAAMAALKDVADEALESSLTGSERAGLQQARQQYRALMQITKSPNIVNPASGDISPRNLARSLQTSDRRGYLRGQNQSDLYEAARFAQAFPEVVGNSGTATRQFGLLDIPPALLARPLVSAYTSPASIATMRGIGQGADLSRKILAEAIRGGSIPASTATSSMLSQMLLASQQ